MAINQVEFRAPPDRAIERRAKEGGGKFGSVAGLVGGGALGYAAAGAVAAGAPEATGAQLAMGAIGGAGAGASLGGLVGEKIKPSTEGSTAIDRRVAMGSPGQVSSSQKLRESIAALHEAPDPVKKEYGPPLVQSYLASLAQEKGGGRV